MSPIILQQNYVQNLYSVGLFLNITLKPIPAFRQISAKKNTINSDIGFDISWQIS